MKFVEKFSEDFKKKAESVVYLVMLSVIIYTCMYIIGGY